RDLRHIVLQGMAALDVEEAAAVTVAVDVDERLPLEVRGVRFGPLGGAEKHRLLAVPAEVDQRALWPPAGPDQLADRLGFSHHRDVAAQRIRGAEHPAVMMVAA